MNFYPLMLAGMLLFRLIARWDSGLMGRPILPGIAFGLMIELRQYSAIWVMGPGCRHRKPAAQLLLAAELDHGGDRFTAASRGSRIRVQPEPVCFHFVDCIVRVLGRTHGRVRVSSSGRDQSSRSRHQSSSRQQVGRRLIKPKEIVQRLYDDELIVLVSNAAPRRCGGAIYFRLAEMLERVRKVQPLKSRTSR
jgi:hypothetical protein